MSKNNSVLPKNKGGIYWAFVEYRSRRKQTGGAEYGMALATTTLGSQTPHRPSAVVVDTKSILLPTEKTEPSHDLSDYFIFLYGQRKIGKTSFTTNFPAALHLFFEPGGKGLSTYAMQIEHWEEMLRVIELLQTPEGDRFQNIVIDTADICYNVYQDWFCRTNYITHPSEPNDYGKTWDALKAGFAKSLHTLTHMHKGVIFISHAKEMEIKTRTMGTYTKIVPTLRDRAAEYIMGASDINAYYTYFGNDRFLVIDGSEQNEDLGGRAMKHHFRTPTGERVVAIPMGNSDEEAYANFIAAFNNQQKETYADIHNTPETFTDHGAVLKEPMKRGR